MTSPAYSEATIELVGRAAYLADWPAAVEADWEVLPTNERRGYREQAQAVLDALFRAGLLLPEGAETHTEWGVETTFSDGPSALPVVGLWEAQRQVLYANPAYPKRVVKRTTWQTPWCGVGDGAEDPLSHCCDGDGLGCGHHLDSHGRGAGTSCTHPGCRCPVWRDHVSCEHRGSPDAVRLAEGDLSKEQT